ncbi:unnamed protein product [Prorocentrum cordatum]|uniref:Sulfotransferase family protein n=1 Tax=Prorocentrum cordatum TaxID=2364126 RepID=A0ABN9PXX6_9DINO|nr:unnamed protein product [Polarella glacialis]
MSEAHRLLFCVIPKNAASEFLGLLMRLEGLGPEHWNPTGSRHHQMNIHADPGTLGMRVTSRRALVEAALRGGEGWVRAVVLRDPVQRFLSAYGSKVRHGHFKQYPSNMTLPQLVSQLEAEGGVGGATEFHLRPQSYISRGGHARINSIERYNVVGRFDELDAFARRVVTAVAGPERASALLDRGWGYTRDQPLFAERREVREAARPGLAMVTTNSRAEAALQGNASLRARIARLYEVDYTLLARAGVPPAVAATPAATPGVPSGSVAEGRSSMQNEPRRALPMAGADPSICLNEGDQAARIHEPPTTNWSK